MANDRVFDPEAIEEYRLFLLELIDALENQVVPVLGTGTLSRAPAFGTAPGAAENAAARYLEFHAATWRHLQYLRGTLHGMEAALAEAAAGGGEAEDDAVLAFAATESSVDDRTGGTAGATVLTADGASAPGAAGDGFTAAFEA
jgi:hypothetical protein